MRFEGTKFEQNPDSSVKFWVKARFLGSILQDICNFRSIFMLITILEVNLKSRTSTRILWAYFGGSRAERRSSGTSPHF